MGSHREWTPITITNAFWLPLYEHIVSTVWAPYDVQKDRQSLLVPDGQMSNLGLKL